MSSTDLLLLAFSFILAEVPLGKIKTLFNGLLIGVIIIPPFRVASVYNSN